MIQLMFNKAVQDAKQQSVSMNLFSYKKQEIGGNHTLTTFNICYCLPIMLMLPIYERSLPGFLWTKEYCSEDVLTKRLSGAQQARRSLLSFEKSIQESVANIKGARGQPNKQCISGITGQPQKLIHYPLLEGAKHVSSMELESMPQRSSCTAQQLPGHSTLGPSTSLDLLIPLLEETSGSLPRRNAIPSGLKPQS